MSLPTVVQATHVGVLADPVPQQVPTQVTMPGGAAAGATTLIIVVLIGFIWYWIKHKKAKSHHLIVAFTAGALLSGSMLGVMAVQTSGSLGTGLMTMLGTVTGGQHSTGTGTTGGQP